MTRDEVIELIHRYDDAWNAQDLDAIMSMHTGDAVFHNHTAGELAEGAEAMRAHIGSIFERYPDLRFEGRSLRVAEDFAASEWTARTTLPDGRRVEWDGVDVFAIQDGLLARKDVYSGSATPRELA